MQKFVSSLPIIFILLIVFGVLVFTYKSTVQEGNVIIFEAEDLKNE
jgi:hypothetical protein